MKAVYLVAGAMIAFSLASPPGCTAGNQADSPTVRHNAYAVTDVEAYLRGEDMPLDPLEGEGVVVELAEGERIVFDLIERQKGSLFVVSGKLQPPQEHLGLHVYPAGGNWIYLGVGEVMPVPVTDGGDFSEAQSEGL